MKQSLLKDEKYRSLFAVLSATGWSLAYPLIKLGYREFQIPSDDIGGKILFAGIRFLCAGLILLGYSFSQKRKPGKLGSNEWTWLVLFALVNITFHYMFAYIGLGYIPGSRGTILDSMGGFLLILLAAWVYPDAQSMRSKWIGCLLGIAGIVLINWNPGHSLFSGISWKGDGMLLLNALFSAMGGLMTRHISKKTDMTFATAISMALGGTVMILLVPLFGIDHAWALSAKGILILFCLILISAVCFGIYNRLLSYHPIGKVAIFNALIPVLGVFFSGLLLQEPLKWQYLVSVALVATGIYIINKEE